MSDTAYAGFLDKEKIQYPYILIDKKELLKTEGERENKLRNFGAKMIGFHNYSVGDRSSLIQNVTNIWGNNSDIAVVADSGLLISSDGLNKYLYRINSAGLFATNNYMETYPPKKHALYFHLINSNYSLDIATYVTEINYTNGKLIELSFSNGSCSSSWFFGKDGLVYFAFNAEHEAKLGSFHENQVIFNYIVNLEPNKLYMLVSFIGVAQGTVKDKAGMPIPNCRLGAFRRDDFVLVGTAISDRGGNYRMPIAASKGEHIFIICLDNDDAPDFEALIYDRIQVL